MSAADTPEAVAIVGMAGRFPKARNLEEFWENLRAGRECVSFFKEDEAQWLPIENPPRQDDSAYVRARAVLERPEWFDAEFFGFNPREAAVMDPQHRVFLECAWEALENAGCNPDTFPGAIGVFAGASMNTYLFTNLLTNRGLVENLGFFPTLLANDNDFIPTRVSYKLNLRGPSINVQTACSTSLVAVSLAAQSLLSYRCDAALAGGVSITFPPRRGQYHVEGGILSHDGHCRAFAAGATGTVLGDGAGVVLLKRLADAIEAGDPIRAIIRGTAINNDGSVKIGYTAPSGDGQAEVIALAQAEAGFAPETVSYIEAHGTGTPLGDPIEIEGLVKAFGLKAERGQFCGLGSVKSNIGHLDITAGVAGLIKTVLALQARELPPSLHFDRPNPRIDFARSPFFVVDALRPWPRGTLPRRAGVSSFGIGGTNTHVALEEAPEPRPSDPARPRELLVVSARSENALNAATRNLADHLETHAELNLADVAWTLQSGRRAFSHRRAVVAADAADAVRRLRDPAASAGLVAGGNPRVVFMFPGQGSQYAGMARSLYESEPVFRETVDQCCRDLQQRLQLDLRPVLFPTPEGESAAEQRIHETAFTQPALFVVEYSLARWWMSRGIQPAATIGHSLGQYVAASVAGVFSPGDALAIVALRARLMQSQPRGAMLAVMLPEEEASQLATGSVALAAVNAPGVCVLAGPEVEIAAIRQSLEARGVGARPLATSHAFHSSSMDPVLAPFAAEIRGIPLHPPRLPCICNVTGGWLTREQATDPGYWTTHLRHTVRFADGIATLCAEDRPVLLEIGPGQALTSLARRHPSLRGGPLPIPTLGRGDAASDDLRAALEALGRLWSAGVPVSWEKWHPGLRRQRVPLPTYPFERQRHWIEPGAAPIAAASPGAKSAPEPDVAVDASPVQPERATVSSRLAGIFQELAGHDFNGPNARRSFAELGLDSLLLTQACVAIQERLGVRVTMRELIESFPTLEKLSSHLTARQSAKPGDKDGAAQSVPAPATPTTVPLTEAQREIWFASQLSPTLSAAYNESCTLHLRGPLDESALQAAIDELAARHESLRITIEQSGETQTIGPAGRVRLQTIDLSGTSSSPQAGRIEREIARVAGETFDLVAGPLWRVHLLRIGPEHHALVLVVHHIICDGWSQPVLLRELGALYSARRTSRAAELPAPASFAEYARQEARRQESSDHTAAREFWLARFRDSVPVLELPSDRPRPPVRTYDAAHYGRMLEANTFAAVRKLAASHETTSFTVLLSGFAALLHRLSGQEDLVIGVPCAPQVLAGMPSLVGHCVNLLPIRSRLGASDDFAGFLRSTRQVALDAFEHWQLPFASLLRRLNLPRDTNRVPLANVTFNVGRNRGAAAFDGLAVEAATSPKRFVNFDLSFNVTETDDGLVVDCHYSSELFDPETAARMLDRFELLLNAAAADPARSVHRLPLLTPGEFQQVVVDWNRTEAAYPRDLCLHELFEQQAERTPDRTAVIWGSERWTYRQLNERSNQIAHRLRRLGVRPETAVGIHTGRTPSAVAALLGILKSGGAYIPLDPAYPGERTAFMLEDSRAAVLITQPSGNHASPHAPGTRILDLAEEQGSLCRESSANPGGFTLPGNLAYVIYTSGSTGRPKGVAIVHRSAVALIYWARDVYSDEELAGVLAATSFCFDLSVFELFVPLSWGGTVILADSALHLPELPARDEVTLVNTVPSAMTELVRAGRLPASVGTINLAGEPLAPALVDQLYALPHVGKVYDLYGPSEDTTYSTFALRQSGGPATIGRPISNTRVYLLDRNLELVPPGNPGELCIAGEGLARGYLNQPVMTARKFVRNPLGTAPADRLYRTGDLARHRPDGTLEYLGRMDHQVKIRGYRVEPGEIEHVLQRYPGVAQCTVLAIEPAAGDRRLAAWYVPSDARQPPDPEQLRQFAARELPEYMVPSSFIALERMPLTPNGKIDRRALPKPEFTAARAGSVSAEPRNPTEEALARIWSELLGTQRIGIHDNFFELGGHSLLATQAAARASAVFQTELSMRVLFEAPTVAGMAARIEAQVRAEVEALSESEARIAAEPVAPR